MRLLVISLIFALLGCGIWLNEPKSSRSNLSGVLARQLSIYKELHTNKQHISNGFIMTDKCDSLLFSSLAAIGMNEEIDILAARNETGQWFRRPSKDCFEKKESASTISRDMFIGLLYYLYEYKKTEIVEDLWNYGMENGWEMGEADSVKTTLGRVIWTPATIGLLAEIRYQLNGKESFSRHLPTVYNTQPGFTSHLSLLIISLYGKMLGGISDNQLGAVEDILKHSPNNAFAEAIHARYTDGNMSRAISLLLKKFPSNRLPNDRDWCEEWYFQRTDNDTNLEPCSGNHEHTGGDFIFVADYILNGN